MMKLLKYSIYFVYVFSALFFFQCQSVNRTKNKPNILLISIDTIRPDHLDAYGYSRKTAPVLSRCASKGIQYSYALSQGPWTLPSMASMHTSLYPSEHNAVSAQKKLSEDIETLAEVLSQEDYYTVGIVSHSFTGSRYGLHQGFKIFDESQILGHEAVTSEALTEIAIMHLEELKNKPFFLWIHYFDPHFSYVRHPEYAFVSDDYQGGLTDEISMDSLNALCQKGTLSQKDIDYVKDVYDEEIAYTDSMIGRVLSFLDNTGLDSLTTVIIAADHGEYFMERGRFFHGKDVYHELVHVPLIITGNIEKKLYGRKIKQPVELTSIPATIMHLAHIENHPFRGMNLLDFKALSKKSIPVFTEGGYASGDDFRKKAVVLNGWKLIKNIDENTFELYDIKNDYHEKNNLWIQDDQTVIAIKKKLYPLLDKFPEGLKRREEAAELDEKTLERLRSLGYTE